jgi:ClpP class serine protease
MALGRGASALVEQQLAAHVKTIEDLFGADVLTYVGPIIHGADDRIKDAVEELRRRKNRLLFILETNGGYAEVARRISDALRHHYRTVDFLIPSHAMSAGTILAMSGDSIWMNYYSVLGPIDPQVPRRSIP